MKYISGVHALNLPCKLNTTGDWHTSAIQWDHPKTLESKDSVFGDWGIEPDHWIPCHEERFFVANHIRACLDMLVMGDFSNLQGMRDDYICWDEYTPLIFEKVMLLQHIPHWEKIKEFMFWEYKMEWYKYVRGLEKKLPNTLAQQAKREMLKTGTVKTKCPKCGSVVTVQIVGLYNETVYIRCKCGFLSCTEHGI